MRMRRRRRRRRRRKCIIYILLFGMIIIFFLGLFVGLLYRKSLKNNVLIFKKGNSN